jgi:hypothetical protein
MYIANFGNISAWVISLIGCFDHILDWTISLKWQSKMDNLEKLATHGTQYEEKHNIICVGHHYAQTNTNNVYKT